MSQRPIIAIIGRPNVGKSTLFNRLLGRRQAIVSGLSGTTRDRHYSTAQIGELYVDIIDTAGLSGDLDEEIFGPEMLEQVQLAVKEADLILFVLDAQQGFTADDQQLAEILRKSNMPVVTYINKYDNPDMEIDPKLISLGLGEVVMGSLAQRRGHFELIDALKTQLQKHLSEERVSAALDSTYYPRVTLAGRPNVGKSTLFNKLVGDDRVIVSDIAGTTRDTIDTLVKAPNGFEYIISDTAGLRRRGKIASSEKVEQYSVMRTFKAIDQADLVLLVVDATEGLTRGDAHVADYALKQNKRLITVINKTDLVAPEQLNFRRFPFLSRKPMIFISAQDGRFVDELQNMVIEQLSSSDEPQSQSY